MNNIFDPYDPNNYNTLNHDNEKLTDEELTERMLTSALSGCLSLFIGIMVGLLLTLLLSGCKATKYVPVVQHHTDTLRQIITKHDSIYLHDSVYTSERVKGDTVWLVTEQWHTAYRDRLLHDTIRQVTHDTIPQPYPVEVVKKVEKKLSWWQRVKITLGDVAFWLLAFGGLWSLRKVLPVKW